MRDPLQDVGTDVGRQIFREMACSCAGKPVDDVISACLNLIANCIRQNVGTRAEAEAKMSELYGRNTQMLLEHYDSVTGRRRSVLPFNQVIRPSRVESSSRFVSGSTGLGGKGNGRS